MKERADDVCRLPFGCFVLDLQVLDDVADCIIVAERKECARWFDANHVSFRQQAKLEEDGKADLVARTEGAVFGMLVLLPVLGEIRDDGFGCGI